MDLDIHARFQEILEKRQAAGLDYASKKSQSWILQEQKSTVLARKIQDILSGNEGLSFQRAENFAKASDEYLTHLKGTAQAIQEEHVAKAVYDRWDGEFEKERSLTSLEKATRQFGG